ncbi:MAG TPA: ATP-binding protein [Candidatus Limnocylindria bacterium]|nr:ATP-binding protein [Candidatus Limnocylindria bacterium]
MNTRSLKFRLVAWYAGWLTVLFLVFGVFVYFSLGHYLEKSLREALFRRARQVADTVERSALEWNVLGQEIQNHFAPEANNRFTRVTLDGVVKYTSGFPNDRSFGPATVPPAPVPEREESFEHRKIPDDPALLIVMVSRTAKAGRMVVEEGHSLGPIQTTLHAWLVILVSGLLLLVLVAVLGGFVLVQRALKPVDRIIRTAEQISSRNLSERLPVPQTRDELERLSISLNNMIRRLEDAFQHTQRFLADASHELRTPLTIIQGELENVVGKSLQKPDVREIAGSALEEVERLKNIVEGLFALSRLDAGEAQEHSAPFDLGELAMTTADQMSLLAEDKKISILCHCHQPVIVEGDRARLKQVTVNLLDNAIKYTNSGGRIDVTVTSLNGHAVLEVADDGIGIPSAAMPHLFERFYRVDKARSRELGGAGLGLSIVKSICVAHNGRVGARSNQGEGTRFTVELPLAKQSSGS